MPPSACPGRGAGPAPRLRWLSGCTRSPHRSGLCPQKALPPRPCRKKCAASAARRFLHAAHPLAHPLSFLSLSLSLLPSSEKRTGEEVAIKLIKRPLPKIILPNILREIRIQAELGEGHINIVDAKAALLTESHLALVMEYAAGGSLTGYVAERWQHAQHAGLFLGEDEARYFFRQFIGAVEYCHAHCVAHRDLKLDNTLLSADTPPVLKLCDFGFAKTWTEDANMYTHIGECRKKCDSERGAGGACVGCDTTLSRRTAA